MEKSKAGADKAFSPPLMRLRDWIFLQVALFLNPAVKKIAFC